jgi:ATP-dependent DNA helicase RecG
MHTKIISAGEGIKTEFKEAKDKLPKSLFETVCAFLNTEGGKIYLGVDDKGKIIGINEKSKVKLKTDVANLSNNRQKLEPVFMLYTNEISIEDKTVLVVEVPESSQVHKTAGEIYARNEDGDYKITQPEKIAAIVNRKLSFFSEQRVYPQFTIEDLKPELFERAKRLISINYPQHPWLELPFETFLHRAGFIRKSEYGKEGYTLAAILTFGIDEAIQNAAPAYKIDALVRKFNLDRYDDRLIIRTNLIDAFDLLMDFVAKHLNEPFYLEGATRISLREKIFRELVSNIIAHREYLDGRPATIVIYKDKVVFSNPNIPRSKGIINPKEFTPFSKNPTISKLMLQMGRVEEVGSGMRNVFKYLPHYAQNTSAEFLEDDMFTTTILLSEPAEGVEKGVEKGVENDDGRRKFVETIRRNYGDTAAYVIELLAEDSKHSSTSIAKIIKINPRSVQKTFAKLREAQIIDRIGPAKGGYWEILSDFN